MAKDTLFESNKKDTISTKMVLIIVGAFIILLVGAFAVWSHFETVRKEELAQKAVNEKTRNSVVMLLAQPRFSGDTFQEQILGKARLQWFHMRDEEVYFSVPDVSQAEFDAKISEFVIDPKKIELGEERDGKSYLGKYSLRKTPETGYFFKTNLENLWFDAEKKLKFDYENASYDLSVQELIEFADNSKVYGGKLAATNSRKLEQSKFIFANHGIMVAKPDEPTLKRFIAQLLKDVPNKDNRETKIQTLLRFVTNEIEYSYSEALSGYETLKRPNEVLMTRSSDCSNKTILMASLLEQIGEEYLMLYSPGHITIAVPQGEFPNENNLIWEWDSKPYVIAETTVPDFEIGKTRLQESVRLTTVQYVQRPKQTNVIFDAGTFLPLEFF